MNSNMTKAIFIILSISVLCACNDGKIENNESSMEKQTSTAKDKLIDEFFSAYEANFNTALGGEDINLTGKIGHSFADCFVESTPAGVNCGKNDTQFVARIKEGMGFYKKIGTKSMTIRSKEITSLDEFHCMAKVGWHYVAQKKDQKEVSIDFEIIYFLRTLNDDIRVFAYIAGDEQRALREKGLIE